MIERDNLIAEIHEYMARMYEESCNELVTTKNNSYISALVYERLRTLEKLANCVALRPLQQQFRQSREARR